MIDINYALVEKKRPPMYTAMKYWGKKPHNIWGEYIENYTEMGESILDPFSGSALAAFEAVKAGRKGIAFDINPLTSFIIEVYASNFDIKKFSQAVKNIISLVNKDLVYKNFYHTECTNCGNTEAILQNFKWDGDEIYEVGVICESCNKKILRSPFELEKDKVQKMNDIKINEWYPMDEFYESPSFTDSFKKNIKGNSFSDIWTKRNLYVLSLIYKYISDEENKDLRIQLMFGFIQILHLTSKMCVPRRETANRGFSTSWGRSAYICSKRKMEMNPLLLFESNTLGKQSVKSALLDVKKTFPNGIKIRYIDKLNKHEMNDEYDIQYGIIDIKNLRDYVSEGSIDFIITDPPYGGLVQYIDLSHVWLIWLKNFDVRFEPDVDNEITVKKNVQELDVYQKKFTNGIKNLYYALKPNGKIVFTFHNKDIMVWNSFLIAISKSGFKIEKVIHQQNKRSGESNVSNPYGTSASDFYIRCVKSEYVKKIKTSRDEFENFVIDRAVKIIESRNEPTPYQILFNGLLSEISKAGFELDKFDTSINQFLENHIGTLFTIIQSSKSHGNFWWIVNRNPNDSEVIPLNDRVEKTVHDFIKSNVLVSIDEIIAEVFIKYPNGLTPDIKGIDECIKKYGKKSGERWMYNGK